jgi:signal transduction histidine kinase
MNPPVNVLLVDDDPRNLNALETILASSELRLVRAGTPDAALLALVHEEFACIVLDIQMPGMSGLELAQVIKTRKRNEHIPIVFLTGYFLEEKDVLEGYGAGAVDYLTKPINPQILRSKVGVFVDLFRTAHALTVANGALELEIAQRKKAEEALRQTNDELEARIQERTAELMSIRDELLAASRAKDDFLAMLSHELRTPLNPILLLASDAVENHDLSPRVRTDFDTIRKNVELEARLIDDLLDLTRVTRGKIILDKHFINLHTVLQDAAAQVREEMNQKQIVLTWQLNAPQHTVYGDAVRLQQIFWNLLKNAVNCTPEGGQITIETAVADNTLIAKVVDNGIGLTPQGLRGLFNAFATTGNARCSGGLGLGLVISQKLAQFHSGQIRATSEGPEKGATFMVELPLVRTTEKVEQKIIARPPKYLPASAPAKKNVCILLVEDHEPTRTSLAHLLANRYYEVITAGSIAEARILAGTRDFHLLISDIGLPDGSGYDLLTELKKSRPVKGIALTGYGMESDVARSQDAGFVTHLTKPVRIQSLEAALNAAL